MDDSGYIRRFERRRRFLPHLEEPGATYVLTFCLASPNIVCLSRADIAPVVIEALVHRDREQYILYDYVVMPDHVHLIMKPYVVKGGSRRLSRILQSLKAWTSRRINEVLGRRGPLWQPETYDHIIDGLAEYQKWSAYIHDNPHRKGLVAEGEGWPWWGKGSGRYEG